MTTILLPERDMVAHLVNVNLDKFTAQQRRSIKGELKTDSDVEAPLKAVCRTLGLAYRYKLVELEGRYNESWVEVYRPI